MDRATHSGKEPAEPSPGDLSICINCGAVLSFNDILVLQRASGDVLAKLDNDARKRLFLSVVFIRERGRLQ